MTAFARSTGRWLARRAENVAAAMLAAMFAAFLLQIAFRYLLNLPIGWTHELSAILWIWLVLWGASFVVSEREEIRFDVIYGAVGPGARRIMCIITATALVALYSVSFPAVVDYVIFMKVQSSSYLNIRFDLLFAIYIVFALAAIVRYIWIAWQAMRGAAPDEIDTTQASSGV
ncbi:TRAP transporter small permease [Microvirga makkahensis]|uniref:TRAP transporter small permease protein n=1 Tax=Microvirga makkahensis TaxID=1128670 RepID=A0A7X3MWI5_9HYPH|nr:TRAP transporter small permease subunit [Microvirga makkahensis]MXQ14325.1 TRAP transporter small permease subunit [Microvirga makkahensis]